MKLLHHLIIPAGDGVPAIEGRIYRNAAYGDYQVRFFVDGSHQSEWEYHTDELKDAIGTAHVGIVQAWKARGGRD